VQHTVPVVSHELVGNVMKAIQGEYNAIHFYEKLAALAPTDQIRKRILDIREDEMEHFKGFSHLYTCLTGQQFYPQITEPMPTNFQNGVVVAFHDEQETSDFYLTVSREVYYDPSIREEFRYNAADEQRHAVWFLYFMNHN
jgi:rubrerythrin